MLFQYMSYKSKLIVFKRAPTVQLLGHYIGGEPPAKLPAYSAMTASRRSRLWPYYEPRVGKIGRPTEFNSTSGRLRSYR